MNAKKIAVAGILMAVAVTSVLMVAVTGIAADGKQNSACLSSGICGMDINSMCDDPPTIGAGCTSAGVIPACCDKNGEYCTYKSYPCASSGKCQDRSPNSPSPWCMNMTDVGNVLGCRTS